MATTGASGDEAGIDVDNVRILIVGVNYRPEATGIGPYTTRLAEHLASKGHQVMVSTTFPHYPQWRWQPPMARWQRTDVISGVQVRRRRVILPRRPTANWRIAYDTSFATTTLVNCFTMPRPNLVLCISPPIQCVFSSAVLARRWRVPLLVLLKDLPLEAALAVGMIRSGKAYRCGEWLERRAYSLADRIVVINACFQRSLARLGVPANKVIEIPDWARIEPLLQGPSELDVRELFGAGEGEFVVLHAGNMGEKQGLSSAVQAAQIAGRGGAIRMVLVGDGPQKQYLQRQVTEDGVTSVGLLPLQPAEVFPQMLTAADALLLHQRTKVLDSVVPSKLLAYMAAGRPIVAAASRGSAAANLVSEAGCGVVVRPEDPQALADAIRELSLDAERCQALGLSGRRFVEEHFQEHDILKKWELLLSDVAVTIRPTASHA